MTTLLSESLLFIKTLITHLWLSVSSVKFYEKVFRSYKGYGFKYAFILSFISSLFCTALLLNNIDKVSNYLDKDILSTNVVKIDQILRQIPEIDYDGSNISIQEETPLSLYTSNNYKAVIFDPDNKLMPAERTKVPVIIGAQKIIINFLDSKGVVHNTVPVKYTQIFGNQPQILTQEVIKSHLSTIFSGSSSIFIYLVFPILVLVIFIYSLLEKSFIILILYIITQLANIKIPLKTSIRMVLFASGIFFMLQCIIALALPALNSILWGVQGWCNILMILGILKASGRSRFFSK